MASRLHQGVCALDRPRLVRQSVAGALQRPARGQVLRDEGDRPASAHTRRQPHQQVVRARRGPQARQPGRRPRQHHALLRLVHTRRARVLDNGLLRRRHAQGAHSLVCATRQAARRGPRLVLVAAAARGRALHAQQGHHTPRPQARQHLHRGQARHVQNRRLRLRQSARRVLHHREHHRQLLSTRCRWRQRNNER